MTGLRAKLRAARYALPNHVGRCLNGPGTGATIRRCRRLERRGLATTVGYFQADDSSPDQIVAANLSLVAGFAGRGLGRFLSVKAPPLGFDVQHIERIAGAAAAAGMTLMFDSHAERDAEPTLRLAAALLDRFPGTGLVLPARWQRSRNDAVRLRDARARIRIVKGEW